MFVNRRKTVFVSRARSCPTNSRKTAVFTFLAELPRFDNSQNVKMMTSDQIELRCSLPGMVALKRVQKRKKPSCSCNVIVTLKG